MWRRGWCSRFGEMGRKGRVRDVVGEWRGFVDGKGKGELGEEEGWEWEGPEYTGWERGVDVENWSGRVDEDGWEGVDV